MLLKHRSLNIPRLHFVLIGPLALVLVLVTVSPSQAQLRSGSNSRSLYQRDAKAMRVGDAQISSEIASKQSDGTSEDTASEAVLAAGHTETKNVSVKPASYVSARRKSSDKVVPAGCTSCGKTGMAQTIDSNSVIEAPSAMLDGDVREELVEVGGCQSCGMADSCFSQECDNGCMTSCDPGCVSPLESFLHRLSIRAEVPLFWRIGQSTPPLVTTSQLGTDPELAGELGQSTTELLRSGVYGQGVQAGVRINLSTWLDSCRQRGVMFRYWNAGTIEDNALFSSDTHPILARPFFNTTVAGSFANDTQLVAFPGNSVGSIAIASRSEVYGLDLVLRRLAYADRFSRFDWIYGYHHSLIGERLNISSQTTTLPAGTPSISVADNFQTRNRLHGFTAGFISTRKIACYQLETMFRLTMGNLQRQIDINGQTTTVSGGTSNTTSQGLLARDTNARSFADNTFVLAPEVGINLAYALTSQMDFSVGYNYLMVPKVAQASRQVSPGLRVNLSSPLVGSADPEFPFHTSRYWVSSLGLGLQIRY